MIRTPRLDSGSLNGERRTMKSSSCARGLIVFTLVFLLGGCRSLGEENRVSWFLTGKVTKIDDGQHILQDAVNVGQILNLSVNHSLFAVDGNSAPQWGIYNLSNKGEIRVAGAGFSATPTGPLSIRINDDGATAPADRWWAVQEGVGADVQSPNVDFNDADFDWIIVHIKLEDTTGNALSSDALPRDVDLSQMTNAVYQISGGRADRIQWTIYGAVETLAVID